MSSEPHRSDRVSEETPLLAADRDAAPAPPSQQQIDASRHVTRQILYLCVARLIEPVAFFSIFPYINYMLQHNGKMPVADVGFYSGVIESMFSLTQMCVMILWSKASDRVGRKPVLVFSLVGVSMATAIFGMATTVWQMVLFRCLAGFFAGTIVTIRTMIAEHSNPDTQAKHYSWFAFSGNMGILIGPLLGGALAEPTTQYPGIFGHGGFLGRFPYALSSFAVSVVGLIAVFVTLFLIEETLPVAKVSPNSDDSNANEGAPTTLTKDISTRAVIKSPGVSYALFVYGYTMILGFAYTAVAPVFWYTPIELGGFGFSALHISLFMGLTGFSQAVWLLFIFPPLQKQIGTNGVMRACGFVYPFDMALNPVLAIWLRAGHNTSFWTFAVIYILISPGISMVFTGVQLLINDSSPSPEALSMINALSLTVTCALRAVSPATFASIFAIGIGSQILSGYFVWTFVVAIAVGFTIITRFLPEASEKS